MGGDWIECYPRATANRNVPKGVLLLADIPTMSGEIVTTYYIDREGKGWKVGDWVTDKPQRISMSEMCRVTAEWESIIRWRCQEHFSMSRQEA